MDYLSTQKIVKMLGAIGNFFKLYQTLNIKAYTKVQLIIFHMRV